MIDFDLQMRFWRSVGDAVFHSAEAAMAMAIAWQSQLLECAETGGAHTAGGSQASSVTNTNFWQVPAPQAKAATPWPLSAWTWWARPAMGATETTDVFGFAKSGASAMFPFGGFSFAPSPAASTGAAAPFGFGFWPSFLTGMTQLPSPQDFWKAFGFQVQPSAMPGTVPGFFSNPALMPLMPQAAAFWAMPMPPMTWACMQLPLTCMMVSAGMPLSVATPSAKASTAAMDAADAARQQFAKVYSAYRSDGGHAAQLVSLPWNMAAAFAALEPKKNGYKH